MYFNYCSIWYKIHKPLRLVEEKEINDDRQDNRADARGTAEEDPGNYLWGGPSVHANVDCWVCSVKWELTSSYDSDHIAADFQGPGFQVASASFYALWSSEFPIRSI